MECSAATGLNSNGIVERHMHGASLPHNSCEFAGAAMQPKIPANGQSSPPESWFSESAMTAHAWNVVQCLLLDFLCSLVRLQGSQVLGAIMPRVKTFCQQHATPSNHASTTLYGADRDARGLETAPDAHGAELSTYRVSWVLNVRLPSIITSSGALRYAVDVCS